MERGEGRLKYRFQEEQAAVFKVLLYIAEALYVQF